MAAVHGALALLATMGWTVTATPHSIDSPKSNSIRCPRCPLLLASTSSLTSTQKKEIDRSMLSIGAPALAGLAIDPLASLVDTAMVGRYCLPADLAGAGVAISVFNLISRTFNFLSSATTSQVAALCKSDAPAGTFDIEMSRAAAAALGVAVSVGLLLTLATTLGGGRILGLLGVAKGSAVRSAARQYLAARAFAFPATLSLMALEGAFRGSRDTKTPLGAATVATVSNIILDPLLILGLPFLNIKGLGVTGAALATTISQYVAAGLLWRRMIRACGDACAVGEKTLFGLPRPRLEDCIKTARTGSVLTLRTFAGSTALGFSSVAATALGAVTGAAHQVCFQLWLATSLLADAVAVAAQALVAAALARKDALTTRYVQRRTIGIGLIIGILTSITLTFTSQHVLRCFTRDAAVLAAATAAWPLVCLSQPINTVAFGIDGLLFGASDFTFCALMMSTAAIPALVLMKLAPTIGGLRAIWAGLMTFMALRAVIGCTRIASASGPWALLKQPPQPKGGGG